MKKAWAIFLTGFGAIIWLMLVLLLYYAGHKPFSLDTAITLFMAVKNLLISIMILSIAGGIGKRLLYNIHTNPLTAMALQSGVGLGLISLVALILGSTLGFKPLLIIATLIISGLLLWRSILAWWRQIAHLNAVISISSRVFKIIAGVVVLLFLLTLSIALSPPVKFDALVYHLYLPAYYLDVGKFVYHPRLFFWGMPQLAELLYTVAMAISGSEAASLVAWSVGLISIVGILGYVYERLGITPAWISVVTLMSGYTLVMILPTAYVEWFSILYGFGLFVLIDLWSVKNRSRWLIWAGIFVGLGMGVKYSNGVLLIAGLFVILVKSVLWKHKFTRLVKDLILICAPALLMISPWLIKNLLATGNPFYPFLYPSGAADSYRLNFYQSAGVSSWVETLLLPLNATIRGLQGTPGYSATIGPLFLALCPLAFIGYRSRPESQRSTILTASVISIAGIAVWMIAGRISGLLIQSRLYFSLFPALACLAGAGFSAMADIQFSKIRLGRIIGVLVLLVFFLNAFEITREIVKNDSLKTIFGLETTESYLGRNLGWYYPAMEAVNGLPDDARVLMLWEPRAYYCLPKCIPDEVLDRWSHELSLRSDAETIINNWKQTGITHILYNKLGAEFTKEEQQRSISPRHTQMDWQELERLFSLLGKPVDIGPDYQLYSLNQKP